jgi:amino acid adenylation domain-containing protein
VEFHLSEDSFLIKVEHDCSTFDETQGQRIAATIRNVILKMVSNPSEIIAEIDLIGEEDLKQIWDWNHEIPKDPELCAHHIFEKRVKEAPESRAIQSWDGNMTYLELEKLSSTLGAHLSARGIEPNMTIPICFEKCKWTIVAMMGVLKAGASFTTLDPVQPTNRLEDIIMETKSKTILVSESQGARFEGHGWDIMANVPDLSQQDSPPKYTQASLNLQPTDLSYVAFTSGSTGKPKGVAHQHLASCTTIIMKSRDGSDSGYGPGKRIMQFASQAFAASVVEILKTLGNGGCICIPSNAVRLNNITEFMKENGVTRVFLTPALLKLFKPEDFPTLETLLVGGEPVLPDLIETWAGAVKLVEAIGMTEGVAIQTNIAKDGQMKRICQTLSGVPWIVDPDDYNKLAPIGALGELLVEGPCLAKGYLHDDEKTSMAFIEAPLWARKKEFPSRKFRLYRTGDMARYYSDGVVRLLGRRDNRVKVNGQRIELGDVESHMQKNLPQTMTAAADIVTINQSDKERSFLVGFIFTTTEIGKPNDEDDGLLPQNESNDIIALLPKLKESIGLHLPTYMVPSIFLPLKRRPTNMSGKMDRKRLKKIASQLSYEELIAYNEVQTRKAETVTTMEKTVLGFWAKLFTIEMNSIGREDNFLMYGGDSLQAIKLSRLARDSGIVLTSSDILQNPILKNMSLCASQAADKIPIWKGENALSITSAVDIARVQDILGSYEIENLSKATDWQSWATYTGLLKTRGWTDYLVFDFKGSLNVPQLKLACKSLLAFFSILRTVFVVDRRCVMQVILKDYPFDFKTHDLRSDEDVHAVSREILKKDAASKTVLGEPLVRFEFIQGNGSQRLLLRISHAQYDALSLIPMFRVLKMSYCGLEPSPSPSFTNFINFTQKNDNASESFWRNLLQGSKMTDILQQSEPSYRNIVDTTLKRTVPLPVLRSHGVTAATLVLSAWAIVLGELSGTSDVVFGRLTSGRHSSMPGIEDVFGPCMNITPMRVQTNMQTTAMGFLKAIQEQHLASLAYETVGFRHIIQQCTDWAPWTRFSSIVNHVHIETGMEDLFKISEDLSYSFDVFEPMHDKAELWLQTKPVGDQMEVELRFCGKMFSNLLAEKVLQSFCDIIQKSPEVVEEPLSTLIGESFKGWCTFPNQFLSTLLKYKQ